MRAASWLRLLLGIAFVCLAGALVWWLATSPPDLADSDGGRAPAPAAAPAPLATPAPAPPGVAAAELPDETELPSSPWDAVDLEEIRRVMPDNLFWQVALPTDDERILRDREEERARWNVEYGKVLSGNASEAEIHAYYAHRQRLSADYVEFTSYVLDHHGSELSEQDVTLLELARRLHLARLAEYPKQTQVALARKGEQDRAREAWRADEAAFGDNAQP